MRLVIYVPICITCFYGIKRNLAIALLVTTDCTNCVYHAMQAQGASDGKVTKGRRSRIPLSCEPCRARK